MTAAEEATFIALWQQGLTHEAMAQQLACPLGPMKSRLHTLIHQGKIQPRRATAGHAGTPARPRGSPAPTGPVQRPVQSTDTCAVHSVDTDAVQTLGTGAVQRLHQLEGEVQGLRLLVQSVVDRLDYSPVQTPVQITARPPYPKGKAVRWNLWILDAMRDEIATLAAARDISPSQLVQELLWKALTEGGNER